MSTDNKHQNNWAEYSVLPPPLIQIRRFDDKQKNRFYYWLEYNESGQMVVRIAAGITTVLGLVMPASPYLVKWKLDNPNWEELLDDSSGYGTIMHMILGQWLTKKSIDKELIDASRELSVQSGGGADMPDKNILAFIKWCEDYEVKPLLIEAMLVSAPYNGEHYAMTIDLLCQITVVDVADEMVQDGVFQRGKNKGQPKMVRVKNEKKVRKIALVDFKTNFFDKDDKQFYESHLMQLIGGRMAVEHNYPGMPVDIIANWSATAWRTKPNYSFKVWDVSDTDYQLFASYINTARLKGFFTPSGSKFMPPAYNETTKSTDFRIMSYKEYVSDVLLRPGSIDDAVDEDFVDETSPILKAMDAV